MGILRKGQWSSDWYDTDATDGDYVRDKARFRDWVTADGEPGPNGEDGYPAEAGRYHLYISHACPWSHRTTIFRSLKQLEDLISLSVVDPEMLENGWAFSRAFDGNRDPYGDVDFLYQIYQAAQPDYTGRVTVPVLWDRKRQTIISNESADIIRMFNSAFDHLTGNHENFFPEDHLHAIERVNEEVYWNINNGVYRCGFATTQKAYERAFRGLFEHLEILEHQLARQRYLVGSQVSEADWRLFVTLIRFEPVYFSHFKCNLQPLTNYPNLYHHMLELYQWPGVAETVHFDHIKRHYYYSHDTINPTRIVPVGPAMDLSMPHHRDRF
jgi:putative glutathione S-transferase